MSDCATGSVREHEYLSTDFWDKGISLLLHRVASHVVARAKLPGHLKGVLLKRMQQTTLVVSPVVAVLRWYFDNS